MLVCAVIRVQNNRDSPLGRWEAACHIYVTIVCARRPARHVYVTVVRARHPMSHVCDNRLQRVKMSLQVANVDRPMHNTRVFCCYESGDTDTNLYVALDCYRDQIKELI